MQWIVCLGIGAVAGVFSGLFGGSGGWFLVPALTLCLPYAGIKSPEIVKIAIATSLAVTVVTSFVTTRVYAARGSVHWPALFLMLPGNAIGVIGAAAFAAHADVTLVTLVFAGTAIYMASGMIGSRKLHLGHSAPLPGLLNLSSRGLLAGGMVGIVGGGGLSMPIFAHYMTVQRAIGTASALAVPTAVIAVSTYASAQPPPGCDGSCFGYIYLPAVCATGIASVLFAPLGSALAHSLPIPALKRILAAVLVLAALNISRKALPHVDSIEREAKAELASLMPGFSLCKARRMLKPVRFGGSQAPAR